MENKIKVWVKASFIVILFIIILFYFFIIETNRQIIENNYKCIKHYDIDTEWCNCINTSINMLDEKWRHYIPKFVFDNEQFLKRETDIYKEYCLGGSSSIT